MQGVNFVQVRYAKGSANCGQNNRHEFLGTRLSCYSAASLVQARGTHPLKYPPPPSQKEFWSSVGPPKNLFGDSKAPPPSGDGHLEGREKFSDSVITIIIESSLSSSDSMASGSRRRGTCGGKGGRSLPLERLRDDQLRQLLGGDRTPPLAGMGRWHRTVIEQKR